MAKIQIKKSELDRIIKEETLKFKKAITLKKELKNIEEQLKKLNECGVNEVEAGEMHKISSDTGFKGAQAKPKFHIPSKNPNTMMEDGTEEIEDLDVDTDSEGVEDGKIDKAAVLSAIEDLKIALNLHGDAEEEGEEDITVDSEEEAIEDEEGQPEEEESEELNSEEDEEGDETFEFEENEVKGNVEEPVAPKAEEDEEGDTLMESEKRRMAVLAGIIKG